MLVVKTIGSLKDDGRKEIEEEKLRSKLGKDELRLINTLLVQGTFIIKECINQGTKENSQNDKKTGLRNSGGQEMCPMKPELGQARDQDKTDDCKVIFNFCPPPPNETEYLKL